ncbi:MAG: hypothetical protein WCY88_04305 [Spongiibacteraceae bacterium]
MNRPLQKPAWSAAKPEELTCYNGLIGNIKNPAPYFFAESMPPNIELRLKKFREAQAINPTIATLLHAEGAAMMQLYSAATLTTSLPMRNFYHLYPHHKKRQHDQRIMTKKWNCTQATPIITST